MGFLDFLGPIGGLLGGIGSIFGGISGNNRAADANAQSLELARENMAMQKEFAQHGIRWKAEDARAAGVHPLFGLGASTSSFSPVSATFTPPDSSWMGNAGQGIGRALAATSDIFQRKDAQKNNALKEALTLENMGLQNDLVRAQINLSNARLNSQVGPPFPRMGQASPGGGNTGDVVTHPTLGTSEVKPHEIATALPGNPHSAAGPPMIQNQWHIGANGALQPNPHKDLVTDQELTNPVHLRWWITQSHQRPPESQWRHAFPRAIDVRWSWPDLGWVPVYDRSSAFSPKSRATARDVGVGIRHPMLTSRWRDYK